MPKKQKRQFQSKPTSSYVHPSLAGNSSPKTGQQAGSAATASVNDRLETLRRIQGHRYIPQDLSASRYAPKPTNRRVAGPPPPRSWLVGGDDEAPDAQAAHAAAERVRPLRPESLPGVGMPRRRSLMDHALRSISRDIDWHVEFDRHYLSLLPLEIRAQLLSYIACFGPNSGISLNGLRCLFSIDGELEAQGASSANELRRLDLSGSIGRNLQSKELERAWSNKAKTKSRPGSDQILDSWEEDIDLSRLTLAASPLWFPSLTHLSLAYPPRTVSWTDLLSFSRNLTGLTHLSLSGWPRPSLPKAAPTLADASSAESSEEDDARGILKVFSRNTPSLSWLSVARCHGWFGDLSPRKADLAPAGRAPPARPRRTLGGGGTHPAVRFDERDEHNNNMSRPGGEDGAEWTGAWRQVARVDVGQEWLPEGLSSGDLRAVLRGRQATVQGPTWEVQGAAAARETRTLVVVAATEEQQRAVRAQQARRAWLADEARAQALAAKVRALRARRGLGRGEFAFGWDKDELLARGYDEHVLFEAGL